MKAILDHVGIAVRDVDAALAFFRDALGLEVEAPEVVASQRVRTRYLPAGESALELLEATSADSPIAKFLEKRGPGIHHITLRVDDLDAALADLKARGVRLIDETPKVGTGGSPIAFIHPSSTHGVLVELKQAHGSRLAARGPLASRITLGEFELVSLYAGSFRLDGGATFGVVPKPLWEKKAPPDSRNRIHMVMRPLVVRGARTMLIDAGAGDKWDPKSIDIYALEQPPTLDAALAAAGLSLESIDIVVATHLHFDHAGGFTVRDAAGRLRPRFPRAQYIVRRGEWTDAMAPNERTRATYLVENYAPLADAGVLQLVDEDATIMPGVRAKRTGGHTPHHQMVVIESGGRTAAFVADLVPTTAHLPNAWILGYDLFPLDTLAFKTAYLPEAIAREHLIFFGHDPRVAAGYVRARDGKRVVEQVL